MVYFQFFAKNIYKLQKGSNNSLECFIDAIYKMYCMYTNINIYYMINLNVKEKITFLTKNLLVNSKIAHHG